MATRNLEKNQDLQQKALDRNETNVMKSIQKDYKVAYDLITGKLREAKDKWNGLDDTILAKFDRREKLFKELNDILNDLFRKVNRKIKRFTRLQFIQGLLRFSWTVDQRQGKEYKWRFK